MAVGSMSFAPLRGVVSSYISSSPSVSVADRSMFISSPKQSATGGLELNVGLLLHSFTSSEPGM